MSYISQVTETKYIIKIACKDEINLNIVKPIYIKVINAEIENEKIFRKIVMDLMPEFEKLVTLYEIKWRKHKSQFTLLERDQVYKEFEEKHIDKLQGARI